MFKRNSKASVDKLVNDIGMTFWAVLSFGPVKADQVNR